jgi:hypothetical protein
MIQNQQLATELSEMYTAAIAWVISVRFNYKNNLLSWRYPHILGHRRLFRNRYEQIKGVRALLSPLTSFPFNLAPKSSK